MDIDSSVVSVICYGLAFIIVFSVLSYNFNRGNRRLPVRREWWWVLLAASLVSAPICGLLAVYFTFR